MFIRKLIFLAGLTLCSAVNGHTQTVTSIRDGLWTDPSVWSTGEVPTLATASETVIDHAVVISTANVIAIRNVVVNNSLVIENAAVVDLTADALTEKKDFQVFGILQLHDGSTLNGTSISNTSFESGSRYIHLQGPLGFIPYATWHPNSTFEIRGFRTQGYINIAHSDTWKQNFGHVEYNCPQQTTPFVDLNGYLRNIAGNFRVQSTNGHALRMSTTQNSTISVGGDFVVEGPSRIWLSTSPTAGVCNIQGNLIYRSTASGISYLTTKGVMAINVGGNLEINTPGRIHMASTSLDSTGARQTTLTLQKDLLVVSGLVFGPPLPGRGRINFQGSGIQNLSVPNANTFQGSIDYVVESVSTLNLGTSILSNTVGNLVVRGTLQLGSTHPLGAMQLSSNGNVRVQGERIFESGSVIEYNGQAEQWIGNGHPSSPVVDLLCTNAQGVTLLNPTVVKDIGVMGNFRCQFPITAHGDIVVAPSVAFDAEQIILTGSADQDISFSNATLDNLLVDKSGGGVILTSPLQIGNTIRIASPNSTLFSNGNLVLLSTSDTGSGTASVGPLLAGSTITGDVTVLRYMAAEGRIYRYIASPVQNASVASLKDDFPITGTFQDPSSGPGIRPYQPSFYYYNESIGGLQEGWQPYPTHGLSAGSPLMVGRGYCAFMRNGATPVTWDVTGPLNYGDIEMPVAFTPNNQPSNGWNLVGNPYASAIQWNATVKNNWTRANISAVVAIRDNGTGTFQYWDLDDIPAGDDGQIASGQAFWVRATGANPQLVIREGVKALGGAAFLRKDERGLPAFSVSLTKGGLADRAHFKIKPGSTDFLEDGDGLKLDNDFFDLALMSADNHRLAIHASDKFPCDTLIALGLKDLTPGTYHFSIDAKQEFSRYIYTLRDAFMDSTFSIRPGDTVQISVTQDAGSSAFNRLSVHVQELVPDIGRMVQGPPSACTGTVVNFTIRGAEISVSYSLWAGSRQLSASRAEQVGDLRLSFAADSLAPGTHILTFRAESGCHTVTFPFTHTIAIFPAPQLLVTADTVCAGSSATLTAFADQRNVTFHWFSDFNSTDTLSTGYSMETPKLFNKAVYYVAGTGRSGCASERFPVEVPVKTYTEAVISLVGDSLLSSNYETGNRWYFNSQLVETASDKYLSLGDPGVYTLRVDTMGCLAEDTFTYVISRPEPKRPPLRAYPNPASDVIYIKNGQGIRRVQIWDNVGKMVLSEPLNFEGPDIAVSIRTLARGMYTAVIFLQEDKSTFRFFKTR